MFIKNGLIKAFLCAAFLAGGLSAQQSLDVTEADQQPQQLPASKPPSVTVSNGCGTASGTQFNLEGPLNPVPQNTPPVDFLYNRIPPVSGGNTDLIVQHGNDWRGLGNVPQTETTAIYVHRSDATTCSPDFEMGNAPISGMTSVYDPQVVADANNDQFLFGDIVKGSGSTTGVGLRRIPAANLLSTSVCPSGTLTIPQAQTCSGSNAVVIDEGTNIAAWTGLAQDPRKLMSGTGAGDIYAVDISEAPSSGPESVHLTACKALFASLSDCSSPITVSTQSSEIAPRVSVVSGGPNVGTITVTYDATDTSSSGCTSTSPCGDIMFVVCVPGGAPNAPVCGAPILIAVEHNPISLLASNRFPVYTVPVHANRVDASGGQTTFVLWTRCKVNPASIPLLGNACPDADIVMAWSTNLGSSWTQGNLDVTPKHQFMPAIAVDASTGITNIVYNAMLDGTDTLDYLILRQIPAKSTVAGSLVYVTKFANNASADPHLNATEIYGDYINVAIQGTGASGASHAYVGHAKDVRVGTYGQSGVTEPDLNNHVSLVTY